MGLEIVVPPSAEVISAIGDALSLIRTERERTFNDPTPADTQALISEVEAEAIAAGASSSTLVVRVEHVPERGAVRVTVTGSVGLSSGAVPGRQPATAADAADAARVRGFPSAEAVGHYWLAQSAGRHPRVAVFDRYADLVVDVAGEVVTLGQDGDAFFAAALDRHTKLGAGPVNDLRRRRGS